MKPPLFRALTVVLLFTTGHPYHLEAQIFTILSGTSMTIKAGTPFAANGGILTPSSDFTLTGGSLSLATTATLASAPTTGTYISRVYQFSGTTAAFSGTIQINYLTSELNGLPEATLNLNVFNGASWSAYASTTNNTTLHYAVSSPLSNVSLNEFTLAGSIPLPLTWLSFTATGRSGSVLLQWSTASEQSTKDFEVQRSIDGNNWSVIGTVPAAGNSDNVTNYTYLDANPAEGINYYRICETDLDGESNYSIVKVVELTASQPVFTVIANPPVNGVLQVLIYTATPLSLYTSDGQLIWKRQLSPGMQYFDVSRLARELYFLSDGQATVNILIR